MLPLPDVQGPTSTKQRYATALGRMAAINGIGFGSVTLMSLLSLWGQWRHFTIYAVAFGALNAFNVVINNQVAKGRHRFEWPRLIINVVGTPLICHFSGWPIPMWMVLPLVALVFDGFNSKVAHANLALMIAGYVVVALPDGVPWPLVATTSVFSVLIRLINEARFSAIRDMLSTEEKQRLDLEVATISLTEEHEARLRAEVELRQAQKLEAVGRLAAGVAHEINTPVQFVTDSLQFVESATVDLLQLIEDYRPLIASARLQQRADLDDGADLPYLRKHLPEALAAASEGLHRVGDIVRSMKQFAHPDQTEMVSVDLNACLQDTLTISRHEYKLVAEVETQFAKLPDVTCHPGEVNQVFLNLLVNAAHAVGDKVGESGTRGRIVVSTRLQGDDVVISIADTGGGIPEAIQSKVFDPFFTTKPVGQGTGQGLAISRSVAERHGGKLEFQTSSAGTTFSLTLPVMPARMVKQAA